MELNANESVLGKAYFGLRSSSSVYTPNNGNVPNATELKTAPIAPEDVPRIVDILLQCPTGPYALRVFQQHAEGLCWQDSFFIMLYNQDWFRPFLKDSIEFYMQQFFALGYTDLAYPMEKEIEQINWNKMNYKTPMNQAPKIKVMHSFPEIKVASVAKLLQQKYGFGLPLAFWEYYSLQLHRYILLGYLFLKYPDASGNTTRASKPSNLFRRRKSIGYSTYSKLALDYKEFVFRMLETGMFCANFQVARTWFISFVSALTNDTVGFRAFRDPVQPGNILGYYLGIETVSSAYKHMISLFKCQDIWYLYDIDVGTIQFTPEETAKLNSSKIKSIVFENKPAESTFEYTFMLEDGSTIVRSLPFTKDSPLKYEVIQDDFSLLLVRIPKAPQGGRRETRKRKQTRKRKY